MTESQKQDFGNAFHTGTQAINAIATGNYTPLLNNGANMLERSLMGKALKSSNGTVVGYVMNELGNLGYVSGTLNKGPIQTASFAGSLINAATTAVKSPLTFATSLAKNAVGSIAGINIDSNTLANAKTAFNNITLMPGQVINGVLNAANSLASSIGLGSIANDSSTPSAPALQAGTAYNPTNYNSSSSGVGSSTGVPTLSSSSSSGNSSDSSTSSTPSSPSYANNPSPYSSTPYQTGSSYSSTDTGSYSSEFYQSDSIASYDSYNSQNKLAVNSNGPNIDIGAYSAANTNVVDEFARTTSNANDTTGRRSLAAFLTHIENFGVQVQNNFEVEFSGIQGLTLFVLSFEMPGSKLNTCEVYYDGIKITIPVNYEHDHEFSITINNDAQGFIYSIIKSYIEFDSYNHATNPGTTLLVRALTGDINALWRGSRLFATGARFTGISGLLYGQSNNEILTFTVQGTLIEYSHLPLKLSLYR